MVIYEYMYLCFCIEKYTNKYITQRNYVTMQDKNSASHVRRKFWVWSLALPAYHSPSSVILVAIIDHRNTQAQKLCQINHWSIRPVLSGWVLPRADSEYFQPMRVFPITKQKTKIFGLLPFILIQKIIFIGE